MKYQKLVNVFVVTIAILALGAALAGILSSHGPGPFEFQSIHGETVPIYGRGIYRNMSADVAPQGIAQDYVTLVLGIPVLLISLFFANRGSLRARLFLAGALGYFLVTYLFYMIMGSYNEFYLAYAALAGLSFYSFLLVFFSLRGEEAAAFFQEKFPARFIGGFLVFNAVAIGLMWLGVVVPPALQGTVPEGVQHYTTLIVQGMDLSILLPASIISGMLLYKGKDLGYVLGPVYINFLYILMTALSAKVAAITILTGELSPAIVVIPAINLVTVICAVLVFRNVRQSGRITE